MTNIKVLLADDHGIVRDGIRRLLDSEADIQVIGEAENGRQALQLAARLRPDVAVMDISMPELNGIEATRQLLREHPRLRVIALSMHADKRFVAEMLQAGASGYLQKNCAFRNLVLAIRNVAAGQVYLSQEITGVVVQAFKQNQQTSEVSGTDPLSAKEREVLQLVAEGSTTKEIADRLGVSAKTVDTHRQHIMEKLRVRSIAGLTKYAVRNGLTSLEH